MLQFKDVTPQESTLKSLGTVASFAGLGGYHELTSDKNFRDENKRVSISIYNAKGQRAFVNCSKELSANLRESKSAEELQEKITNLATLQILELPQFDDAGNPVIVTDEETGEEVHLTLYTISNAGRTDMSSTRVVITEDLLKAETAKRSVNWESLIAI
jgi:hypothetical protein